MKKNTVWYLIVLAVCAVAVLSFPYFAKRSFIISGRVTIDGRLVPYTQKPNTVCFVVLKNQLGLPVAVKRFVNPKFPVKFIITAGDFIIEHNPLQLLTIQAQVNNRGVAGELEDGDMYGDGAEPVYFISTKADIAVDKMKGLPSPKDINSYTQYENIFKSG